jgi:hypothetical protein
MSLTCNCDLSLGMQHVADCPRFTRKTDEAYGRGRTDERAKIVAWLRRWRGDAAAVVFCEAMARMIEAAEHER